MKGCASPPTAGSECVITWRLWVVCCLEAHVPLGQTHLLPFLSLLLPSLSAWRLQAEDSQPSSPPSCHTCWVHDKRFLSACLMWGQASLGFFYLSELLGVDATMRSKCFRRNGFFWLLCQLVGLHVSQSVPKLALIPAAFTRALWLLHPLLLLAGQNQSSVGRLTAGTLSVQFPPPRQNCGLLGVSFSVVWPLTYEPAPRSSSTASPDLPRCFTRVACSRTSTWDDWELLLSNLAVDFPVSVECSSCTQVCLLSWFVLRSFLFLFET